MGYAEKIYHAIPVYAFNAEDEDDQELLKITSLDEFKECNLFLGSKVLQRV